MPYDLKNPLVIGISSRALFDLEAENRIFETQGLKAYEEYQVLHEKDILPKGPAFPLVRAFLELNKLQPERLVEVIVMSRNSPNTSLRIFNSIDHYGLDVTRAALSGGAPVAPYLKPFETDLFLSAYRPDVQDAINSGIAAGMILTGKPLDREPGSQIRIAFDGAAKWIKVVFTVLLSIGIGIFAVTEAIILYASFGSDKTDHQYIVVLGARVNGTQPSISLADRIVAAYYYMNDHPEVIAVLSGGQGPNEDISEAQCMYRALTALGIAPERLRLEEMSTSTWENLTHSLDLIKKETGAQPQTIGLVSSEYHLFRAGLFAQKCGVTANGIPATTSLFTIRVNHLLREVAGVWHYLLLGGQYQ